MPYDKTNYPAHPMPMIKAATIRTSTDHHWIMYSRHSITYQNQYKHRLTLDCTMTSHSTPHPLYPQTPLKQGRTIYHDFSSHLPLHASRDCIKDSNCREVSMGSGSLRASLCGRCSNVLHREAAAVGGRASVCIAYSFLQHVGVLKEISVNEHPRYVCMNKS